MTATIDPQLAAWLTYQTARAQHPRFTTPPPEEQPMTPDPKFKVSRARFGWDDRWTITEDGQDAAPVTWVSRAKTQDVLTRIRDTADQVARGGYYQGDARHQVYMFVNRHRVDVILPHGFTAADRDQAIRTAVIRHLLDQETGDPS